MGGPAPYTVRVAVGEADRSACFDVRADVFIREQKVPGELEYDEHDAPDAATVHVLAVRADGTPVGTGRLLHGPVVAALTGGDPAVGVLGRLAVTGAARGLGVGAALVRAIESAARERGLTALDLHAQTQALAFYERLGYTAYGPELVHVDIPHRAMRRALP
ncbi:GNAT family N-acetyltransferase [Streptomyces yaizuensis]|uniref:GNAT family N-acetyltransferase n=1 Tax=Streptomyces yaizuensis TaxID=2989713 RepID=UPI002B207BF1|nr:GNAT family N-acetyltransferase [Streptomyces sp. YSPA8]